MINYVKEKKQEEIELTSEKEKEIEKTIEGIIEISKMKKPPTLVLNVLIMNFVLWRRKSNV